MLSFGKYPVSARAGSSLFHACELAAHAPLLASVCAVLGLWALYLTERQGMTAVVLCCCLCSADLAVVNRRRVIRPISEANADVCEFFTAFVRPGYEFGEAVHYVCRTPCFSNLVKTVKCHVALMATLGVSACLRRTCARADAGTQTDTIGFTSASLALSTTPLTGVDLSISRLKTILIAAPSASDCLENVTEVRKHF